MTDPILEVAEELEQYGGHFTEEEEKDRERAAKLRAYWTPERAAFVKAAEAWMLSDCTLWDDGILFGALVRAYRAMVEADKGREKEAEK